MALPYVVPIFLIFEWVSMQIKTSSSTTKTATDYNNVSGKDFRKMLKSVLRRHQANIVEGATDKKEKQKEVYIDLGSSEGAVKGLHMGVFVVKTVAGKEARQQVGKLKIEEVEGDEISLCKVQSGGKDIKAAIDEGKQLVVLSID